MRRECDKAVERRVSSCLAYQASVESKAKDPLKLTKALEEVWSRLYADHWGPTQDGHHILVIMDGARQVPGGGGGQGHGSQGQHPGLL